MTQPTLYGSDLPTSHRNVLPPRIRDMHTMFGATPGRTCRTCAHLERHKMASTWYKCLKTDHTAGAATDWRTRWPACGLFEERQTTGANAQ